MLDSGHGAKAASGLHQYSSGGLVTVPALFVLGSLALAALTVVADQVLTDVIPTALLFRGDSDSARSILTSIAGAAITLTGLVFSVTMLVLQLTGSQYSPRSVGMLLKNRTAKFTLGVFVGTFTYSLAVLSTIDPVDGFSRGISVAVGVLLALVTVGFFVNYVNYVASQIRPSAIIGHVASTAETAIDGYLVDDEEEENEEELRAPLLPTVPPDRIIPAPAAGTVQSIAIGNLVEQSTKHDLRVRVIPAVGEFVPQGAPLMHVWGTVPDDGGNGGEGSDHLDRQVMLGSERDPRSDPRYGLRQLVDIAERALSPGTNDPTTAAQAVDRIHNFLRLVVCRSLPNGLHADENGRVRVVVSEPDWDDLLDLGVDEIAHYGENSLQIGERLTVMLRDLLDAAPPERAPSIARKLGEIERPA